MPLSMWTSRILVSFTTFFPRHVEQRSFSLITWPNTEYELLNTEKQTWKNTVHQKLTVIQEAKCTTSLQTQRFITSFMAATSGLYHTQVNSAHISTPYSSRHNLMLSFPIYNKFPKGFQLKFCTYFSSFLCTLHALLTISSLFVSP